MSAPKGEGKKVLLRNSRARHDYFIEETLEAGMVLVGSEVKSLRDGKASLNEAYAKVEAGEVFLVDMQVTEWAFANRFNHSPRRPRKLLLHKAEIKKLDDATAKQGYTLLPAGGLSVERQDQGPHRPGQGQEALRQARRPKREGRQARHQAGNASLARDLKRGCR
jgi:SsrA-binding protein